MPYSRYIIGYLIYADDIILLYASVGSLQKMLHIWYVSGTEIDMFLTQKKINFVVGKAYDDVKNEYLKIGHNGSTENAGPENEGPMRDQLDQRPWTRAEIARMGSERAVIGCDVMRI